MLRTPIQLALFVAVAQGAWGQSAKTPKYLTIKAALKALKSAGDDGSKQEIYKEIGRLKPESGEDVRLVYDEAEALEKKVSRADQREYLASTKILCQSISGATDPKLSTEIASLLSREYSALPKKFVGTQAAKNEVEALQFQMRQARLQALTDVAGRTHNRTALSTLRKLSEQEGAPRYFAVMAIGQIGDTGDLEDFIEKIKRDPKSHFNLSSFGPAAVDPILREVESPAVSDAAKGVLAANLEYLATPDNVPRFRELLKHKNQAVREQAAKGLSRVVRPGDEDVVIDLARDHTNMYQLQAFRAMNRTWSVRYVPVLRELLLGDPDPIIRAEAARMIGAHKVREALSDLEKAKRDRDDEVRRAADLALKNF